jgi:hypothetical protein
MIPKYAAGKLRKFIGKRGEHHLNCSSRKTPDHSGCDCYAKGREGAHRALDSLIRHINALRGSERVHLEDRP